MFIANRRLLSLLLPLLGSFGAGVLTAGCETAAVDPAAAAPETAETEDDLTSNTALARSLAFSGVVYLDVNASAYTILAAVKKQNQSAFGAFRTATVGVNSRELGDIDAKAFIRTPVDVIDVSKVGLPVAKKMLRVSYTYRDTAVVPKSMSKRSSLTLGMLSPDYGSQTKRILLECTDNDKEANEFENSIWYVFNPSLQSCKTAMAQEQKVVNADRAKLKDPKTQVTLSEVSRLYTPMTAALSGDKTNKNKSYPEYDKLWSGGIKKGRLIVSVVGGLLADWEGSGPKPSTIDDEGYHEWFAMMREVYTARPGFQLVRTEPAVDLGSYQIDKVKVTGAKFADLMRWELDGTGWPAGIATPTQQKALRQAVADKILHNWLTFEVTLQVQIGAAAKAPVVVEIDSYFGSGGDSGPHKRAIKSSDVFIYNGHSYIGYGPLDPSNFSASDFPSSYQLFFIDSCVSYNYYEKDYFPLKKGTTANLELITNGMETWTTGSGGALGKFIATLVDGKQHTYSELLKSAEVTNGYDWGGDALRMVDGELDNLYSPTKTPIVVTQ